MFKMRDIHPTFDWFHLAEYGWVYITAQITAALFAGLFVKLHLKLLNQKDDTDVNFEYE